MFTPDTVDSYCIDSFLTLGMFSLVKKYLSCRVHMENISSDRNSYCFESDLYFNGTD